MEGKSACWERLRGYDVELQLLKRTALRADPEFNPKRSPPRKAIESRLTPSAQRSPTRSCCGQSDVVSQTPSLGARGRHVRASCRLAHMPRRRIAKVQVAHANPGAQEQ